MWGSLGPAVALVLQLQLCAVALAQHEPGTPAATAAATAAAAQDLVYQLHDLAESVQLPPTRDYALASLLYRQAIALEPLNAALRYNYGIVLKNLGDHRAAIESYTAALELDPTLRQAHFNLARSLQMLSEGLDDYSSGAARETDLESALAHFEASVTASEPGGLKNAEEVLYQLGRHEEAQSRFMQYVQLRPRGAAHAHAALRCEGSAEGSLRHYLSHVVTLSGGALQPLPEETVEALCSLSFLQPRSGSQGGGRRGAAGNSCGPLEQSDRGACDETLDASGTGLLHPSYEPVAQDYSRQRRARFSCPAALSGLHGEALARYYDVWHGLNLTYREANPHSEDFLARGRHALDNEALSLFIADQLAPSVSAMVGAPVKTSFTKVAVMDETAYLPKHRDEATSTLTITAVIRAEIGDDNSSSWPIYLQPPPAADGAAEPVAIDLALGDCLFFNGRDFLHWRDYTDGHPTGPDRAPSVRPRAAFTMLLLHYVMDDFPVAECVDDSDGSCRLEPEYVVELEPELQLAAAADAEGDSEYVTALGAAGESAGECQPNELCEAQPVEMVRAEDRRYLIYSPCVITSSPGVCSQQFNNQMWGLQHAMAVAEAMGRTLVLPEFMVIRSAEELVAEATAMAAQHTAQDDGDPSSEASQARVDEMLAKLLHDGGDQLWFPCGHFFDLEVLAASSTHGVIEAHEFVRDVLGANDVGGREGGSEEGPVLASPIVHPPYLVPRRDERKIYDGFYFRRMGLRWLHGPKHPDDGWARPTRISVHSEVVQASSGRGDVAYSEGEGMAYWRAVEDQWSAQAVEVNALLTAESSLPADVGSASAIDQLTSSVMAEHVGRLNDAVQLDEVNLADPAGDKLERTYPRFVAFDFAPSYNFQVDRLQFDPTLRQMRQRLKWVAAVRAPAERLEDALRSEARRVNPGPDGTGAFVAVHLRRRGYEHFCGAGLDYYQRLRFGVEITEEMCMPSAESVAEQTLVAARRVGTDLVFVATDEPDEDGADARALRAVGLKVWIGSDAEAAPNADTPPELLPLVEQATCVASDHFVGNLASTFSFTIAQQRDVRGEPRNSMSFWGIPQEELVGSGK